MSDDICGCVTIPEYKEYLADLISHVAGKYSAVRYGRFEDVPAQEVSVNDTILLHDPIRVVVVTRKTVDPSDGETVLEFMEVRVWQTNRTYSADEKVQVDVSLKPDKNER